MKTSALAFLAGLGTFLACWWVGTAILPPALLMPVGALSLVGAFLIANIVESVSD